MASDKSGKSARPNTMPSITISHQNTWIEAKHGAAFLGPIIAGILRRRATPKTLTADRPQSK